MIPEVVISHNIIQEMDKFQSMTPSLVTPAQSPPNSKTFISLPIIHTIPNSPYQFIDQFGIDNDDGCLENNNHDISSIKTNNNIRLTIRSNAKVNVNNILHDHSFKKDTSFKPSNLFNNSKLKTNNSQFDNVDKENRGNISGAFALVNIL